MHDTQPPILHEGWAPPNYVSTFAKTDHVASYEFHIVKVCVD